jgi:replicative DNA helicase
MDICQDTVLRCADDGAGAQSVLTETSSKLLELASTDAPSAELAGTIADRVYADLEERYATGDFVRGVPTGYASLDSLLCGMNREDLIVLAGRPSMGKTSLALCIALNVALNEEQPLPVLVFSLEMSATGLMGGMLSARAQVDGQRIKTANLLDAEFRALDRARNDLRRANLVIDDCSYTSPQNIRARALRSVAEFGQVGLIVVDYLQLMHPDERQENRLQEISSLTRGLKALAKEVHAPIMVLSQLSRGVEQRENKRPMLSDLRESGQIEADADVVMFVYREDYYERHSNTLRPDKADGPADDIVDTVDAEIIVAKHRSGPTGSAPVRFRKSQRLFL